MKFLRRRLTSHNLWSCLISSLVEFDQKFSNDSFLDQAGGIILPLLSYTNLWAHQSFPSQSVEQFEVLLGKGKFMQPQINTSIGERRVRLSLYWVCLQLHKMLGKVKQAHWGHGQKVKFAIKQDRRVRPRRLG